MTKDGITNMPAGIQVDMLIATQVFKRIAHPIKNKIIGQAGRYVSPLHYSIAIMPAWEVRDKIKSNPDTICVDIWNENEKEYCSIHTKTGVYFSGECKTSPLAICRAALLSVVGEQ